MTLGNRKRSAAPLAPERLQELFTLQDELQSSQSVRPDIFQALLGRLLSGNRDDAIASCALLASLDLSLGKILKTTGAGQKSLLDALFELISGPDITVTAEAASVLRAWSTDTSSVRTLYAHCVFPRLLRAIPQTLEMLRQISDIDGTNNLQLLEDWLLSFLLVLWAIVEEIPAALPQLNNSMFVELVLLTLEKRAFLSLELIIILLRTMLCAREDNEALLNDVQRVRLDSYLGSMLGLDELADHPAVRRSHLALLSGALLKLIREEGARVEDVNGLLLMLRNSPPSQDELLDAHLELASDLFEILANIVSDVYEIPSSIILQAVARVTDVVNTLLALRQRSVSLPLLAGCLQRALTCASNLSMSWPDADPKFMRDLWDWCRDQVLPSVCDPVDMLPALSSLAELMRNLLISSLTMKGAPLTLTRPSLLIIQQICTQYSGDDSVVENLLSLPAILYEPGQTETLVWLNEIAIKCAVAGRSWKTILAVAEACEELGKLNALDVRLVRHIATNRNALLRDLRRQLSQLEEDREDELAYIKQIIESL